MIHKLNDKIQNMQYFFGAYPHNLIKNPNRIFMSFPAYTFHEGNFDTLHYSNPHSYSAPLFTLFLII